MYVTKIINASIHKEENTLTSVEKLLNVKIFRFLILKLLLKKLFILNEKAENRYFEIIEFL